jgi:hypothetical protein
MKTLFRNKIALLFFALIMIFSPIIALGQGLYNKKSEQKQVVEEKTDVFLRVGSTQNEKDKGNANKIEETNEKMPLTDSLIFFTLAALGYGLFIWRREQKQKQKNIVLFLIGVLLFPTHLFSQTATVFVNTGDMHVGRATASTDISLAVFGSMVTQNTAVTNQESVTTLTGNFYHDATTHAFTTDTYGWGTSIGTIVFRDGEATLGNKRYIAATYLIDGTGVTFDRGLHYVAFPHIEIATTDTLVIPSRMGLDAATIRNSGGGKMLLKSTVESGSVYDASLRISGSAGNADVNAGSVIIERDLRLYRDNINPLFAFASPNVNMRSGYFAGNWIRKMLPTGSNKHVEYPYGNMPNTPANGYISTDQYLKDPTESFVTGDAYLIKPRPTGFNYQDLVNQGGLSITGTAGLSLFDTPKFVFNGTPYTLPPIDEQVFAEKQLFTHTLTGALPNTVNWVIGNSWTSAISLDSLRKVILDHPDIWFESIIYLFPAGSTNYQPYYLSLGGNFPNNQILDPEVKSIPSQSIFMLRVLSDAQARTQGAGGSYNQHGTFTLQKRNFETKPGTQLRALQIHSNAAHNNLRASEAEPVYRDEVLFRITPEANPNIYDLAAISLRQNTQETFGTQDFEKVYLPENDAFSLFTLSADDRKLTVNAVPPGTRSVKLCLDPGISGGKLTLTASRTESLDQIWLEDLFTHLIINLKQQDTYTFVVAPKDTPNRFIVHFNTPTGLESISENFLQCYYSHGELVIKGLLPSDVGGTITVFDIQGRALKKATITQTPETHLPFALSEGVYITKLQGNRTVTVKFMKSNE